MKIAIVGTGISGLVAAHLLHREHEIVVYEAGDRVGGHTNTIRVDTEEETHWIDTGFIVFNDRNYPNFERLLSEMGVATQPSHMSFSVSDGHGDFEYAGTPRGLFARRANLLSPSFLAMLRNWRRFNREARALASTGGTAPSLGHWLEERGFSRHFVERLIVPQISAVWSADREQMWSFPASFMAEFFENHGMYSLRGRPRWRTVAGGSIRYVKAMTAPWRDRIRLRAPVRRIERLPGRVRIAAEGCESEDFDEVVIATHSDQALRMLADPTGAEREILGAIPYRRNEAVLHTDTSLMPRRRATWSSWNFHLTEEPARGATVTYWMNNLQRLRADREFLVTLNRGEEIDPEKALHRVSYDHPVYTAEGVAAQARHAEISGTGRTHYCAARDAVEAQTGRRPGGPVRLLANLRYLGHAFNPVSLYYCFDPAGERVEAVVADVNNIPWGERHPYVLARGGREGAVLGGELDKALHVSPLMGMDQTYAFRATEPGDRLIVQIESRPRDGEGGKTFDATLSMRRRELSGPLLTRMLVRYPAMSLQVVAKIYAQSLRLKLKGARYFPHPEGSRPKGFLSP